MGLLHLLNPFAVYRHHLQNEMARRVIAANPTPAERARAQQKALGKLGGTECATAAEWDDFVDMWLPILHNKRVLRIQLLERIAELTGGATDAQAEQMRELERPVTWQEITAYVRAVERRPTKRPPRILEPRLLDTCYSDGRPMPEPRRITASGNL